MLEQVEGSGRMVRQMSESSNMVDMGIILIRQKAGILSRLEMSRDDALCQLGETSSV